MMRCLSWMWLFLMGVPGVAWSGTACPPAGRVDVAALVRAHGLGPVKVDIPADEADAQQALSGRGPCLGQALDAALEALLHDSRDPESAAAMLAHYGYGLLGAPGALLRLARRHEHTPWGESVADAWIFVLTMPALSDHVYWVRVPRGGVSGEAQSRGYN